MMAMFRRVRRELVNGEATGAWRLKHAAKGAAALQRPPTRPGKRWDSRKGAISLFAILLVLLLVLAGCAGSDVGSDSQRNMATLPSSIEVSSIREFQMPHPQSGLM